MFVGPETDDNHINVILTYCIPCIIQTILHLVYFHILSACTIVSLLWSGPLLCHADTNPSAAAGLILQQPQLQNVLTFVLTLHLFSCHLSVLSVCPCLMTLYTIITSLQYSCAVSHNVEQGGNHTKSLRLQQTTKLHCMCHQTLAWNNLWNFTGKLSVSKTHVYSQIAFGLRFMFALQANAHLRATYMNLQDTEQKNSSKTLMHSFYECYCQQNSLILNTWALAQL